MTVAADKLDDAGRAETGRMVALDHVTVQYYQRSRVVTALSDVSFIVHPGQSVGILGTKGSGKTTLIRLLAKLEQPMTGRVVHHNMTASWPLWARTGLIRGMTVRDNIRFTAQLYGRAAPDLIRSVDDFAGLGASMDRLLGDLPASTMAKVMFSAAVGLDFDFYPIDGLNATSDLEFRRKADETLQMLRRRAAIVLATGRAAAIKQYCDVAYVLHRGVLTHHDTIDKAIRYFRTCSAEPGEEAAS
ncbi:ATP-binding cassette domain-containing protein [Zavarzinia aquatilis]|uniref:ATP-binding cassette domain-containing protein n=1 Tax=Zavarzinia aquatilis TaxID=2211142 RepID=UPI001402151F|nr:ATP-binding cassette domain-containing protein [Zavarzinia aquatilis]